MVLSAIGAAGGFGSDKPATLYSEGAATIISIMHEMGIKRVFFISASAIETSPVLPLYIRVAEKYIVQKLLKHMYADLRKMESIIKATAFEWTIMRPPQMSDTATTGKYRFSVNAFLKNCLKIQGAILPILSYNTSMMQISVKELLRLAISRSLDPVNCLLDILFK